MNERNRRRERGQALMESALVLPVLFLVFLAIFDFGRLIFMYAQVMNGAREGARYGSVTGLNPNSPQFLDCAGIRAAALNAYGLPATPQSIRVEYDNGAVLYPYNCDSNPGLDVIILGDRVRVTMTTQFRFITPVLDQMAPITVSMTSARTILRGGTLVPDSP